MVLEVDEIEVGPEVTSLQLLQAVYRSPNVPLPGGCQERCVSRFL